MNVKAVLAMAAGVVSAGSLLFALPDNAGAITVGQTGAPGVSCVSDCSPEEAEATYQTDGYIFDEKNSPGPAARLFHVKLRGHKHILDYKLYGANGKLLLDLPERTKKGENAWVDPRRVSNVQITLASRPPVSASTSGSHCYFEDKEGSLADAGGPCTTS